jgi:hypothetical protein
MNKFKAILLIVAVGLIIPASFAQQEDKPISEQIPDSSLFEAAVAGNLEAVKQHIAAGTDLNQVDPTPLHTAALFCYPEIAQALLDNGADKTIKDNDGQTALEMVVFPWEIAKGIYELLDGIIFKPAGKPLDYNRIQKTRPEVAAIIRKAAINRNAVSAEARQLAQGEISLTNGDIIEGTVADVDQNGIVVRRDIGGFAQRANWMQLTQQSLKKIRRLGQVDPKRYRGAAAYAEPFIEPDESEMERNLLPGPVKGLVPPALPSSVEVSSKVAAFGSVGGLGLLVAIALASMMAGLGVAAFRESNALLVAGVSLFLPVIGPILFLVKPKVEYEDEYDEDEEYEYEEAETPAGATMTDTGGGAVAGMIPKAKKMSFAQAGSRESGLKPQSWTRGETQFDRSFFQNNFPNYFKTVLGAAERGLVLALKTGKREYIGQRIKRISGTDIHMELLNGKEQKISFREIGTVDLRPK